MQAALLLVSALQQDCGGYRYVLSTTTKQGSYALLNLMARYDFTKQLYAQLNINNVFDEEYFAMFDAYDQMTYGAPRSATLKMTYKF